MKPLNALLFLLASLLLIPSSSTLRVTDLTPSDQLSIINQLHLHQSYIDNSPSLANATLWLSLYWPDASFTATDAFGSSTRTGAAPSNNSGLKYFYDFDHSVFPLQLWFHSVDVYRFVDVTGNKDRIGAHWRWRVDWKSNNTGVVSTGTYDDVFERRKGLWKCLSRVSNTDPNWPTWVFKPYADVANLTFQSSG